MGSPQEKILDGYNNLVFTSVVPYVTGHPFAFSLFNDFVALYHPWPSTRWSRRLSPSTIHPTLPNPRTATPTEICDVATSPLYMDWLSSAVKFLVRR